MTKKTELKLYGYLMFFFGVIDVLYLVMDIRETTSLLADYSNAVEIFVYVFFGLCALITLSKFWMGRQALCYVKGVGKGTSHILLAKIGIFFTILVLASDAIAYFNGTSSIFECISTVTSLMVVHGYYTAAKACL